LLSAKHMEGMGRYLLSLYHFRKQLSYFLNLLASTRSMFSIATYSFTSLHSGAKDADMMLGVDVLDWTGLDRETHPRRRVKVVRSCLHLPLPLHLPYR
jgi:hypothetical protein